MTEMRSPDGTDTVTAQSAEGEQVLRALGWTGGSRPEPDGPDTEERPRRGPGRPRKSESGR